MRLQGAGDDDITQVEAAEVSVLLALVEVDAEAACFSYLIIN